MINRGLLLSATGAVLGGSYLLIKNPPDINKLIIPAEKMWNRLVALRTRWALAPSPIWETCAKTGASNPRMNWDGPKFNYTLIESSNEHMKTLPGKSMFCNNDYHNLYQP